MEKALELENKLIKAQEKQIELEEDIKLNKNREEKHRKNALLTNCIVFAAHFIFSILGQPLLIVAALMYNMINMIIRAHLMFKAEDKQEKSQVLLKECKELVNMYKEELNLEKTISSKKNNTQTINQELPLKSTKSDKKDSNKTR